MSVAKRGTNHNIALVLYAPGDKVPYKGRYALVDFEGNHLGYDCLDLDGGQSFPVRDNPCIRQVYYLLIDDESDLAFSSGMGTSAFNFESASNEADNTFQQSRKRGV